MISWARGPGRGPSMCGRPGRTIPIVVAMENLPKYRQKPPDPLPAGRLPSLGVLRARREEPGGRIEVEGGRCGQSEPNRPGRDVAGDFTPPVYTRPTRGDG